MKLLAFCTRNAKEILRDPLAVAFSAGFPIALLLLLTAIQSNVPVALFEIERLAPGIAIFGLSFLTLFCATLLARDRESSLLQRLYATPLTAVDFIAGYALPILPIAAAQSGACYLTAVLLGLPLSQRVLYAVAIDVPISVLYLALGLLCGSVFTVKQVGGICGALLTNLSAWLSGTWFDLELAGGAFERIAYALPFIHAVELERAVLSGNLQGMFTHFIWVAAYTVVIAVLAIYAFLRQMRKR
ncbi:MAG TPA: ABC transporter permease [Candidatus Aphodomonas merdavium]|nr:ABC transporter permease [Candidatus Aphodomonas merdavium]